MPVGDIMFQQAYLKGAIYMINYSRRDILKTMAVSSIGISVSPVFAKNLFAQDNSRFTLIKGGTFTMGTPKDEFLREEDEAAHTVTVSDFYMSKYHVTQKEYSLIMGNNPSNFQDDDMPVENVTWYDAVAYCNALSIKEGLTPAYKINGRNITWDRNSGGYRLPTEAEWEYAARAGTVSPFYTGRTITTNQANWYGTYPYYYDERSSIYRQETVKVGSFEPNPWGLYDMSGNVWDWCWDWYGAYNTVDNINPTGAENGVYKVHRGGGWNDFARHLRSGYRAAAVPYNKLYNIGFRVVRSAAKNDKNIINSIPVPTEYNKHGKNLVVYFTWSGNTERLAKNIHERVGGDIIRLEMQSPYSRNYSVCLSQSRNDQEKNIYPAIKNINIERYSNIYLGYPTWWATMPMPVWTFLKQHNFKNKRIIPFASHGEGLLAQTISAIAKTVPETSVGEAFSITYADISKRKLENWLIKINS